MLWIESHTGLKVQSSVDRQLPPFRIRSTLKPELSILLEATSLSEMCRQG